MLFFRSEEHLRNWEGFSEHKMGGVIPLHTLMKFFSGPYFTQRREPDYFSHMGPYLFQMIASLDELEDAGGFWKMKGLEKLGLSLGRRFGMV
jgi:hypothetical protein